MRALLASPAFLFGLELFLKSSLVLILGLAVAAALRGRSAALRHFLLTVFLVGLLALPFLSRLPGGWMLRVLPVARVSVEPSPSSLEPALPVAVPKGSSIEIASLSPALAAPSPPITVPARVPPTIRRGGPSGPTVAALALGLTWLLGAVLLMGRLILGLLAAFRWTRQGLPLVHPDWRVLLSHFKAAVSLKRSVRLRRHGRVSVPFTWGLWRPAVLMPERADDWSEDARSTALFHELAHIKRVDYLIMFLARLSLAVYWLNPLTWVVFRALRREQEKACDELVLKAGIKPSTYAENLMLFRSRMGRSWSPAEALLGLFGRTSFSDRLAAILNPKTNFTEVHMKTKGLLIVIVVLTLALVGLARPAGPATDKTPKPAAASAAVSAPAEAAAPVAVAAQATPAAQATEKEKEKKDQPKPEPGKDIVKKIVFVPGPGLDGRIELKVIRGDKVENFVFDGTTVDIRTDSKGKAVLVTSGGKEIELGEGAQVRLKVRSGDWDLHKAKEVIKLDKGDIYRIAVPEPPEPEGVTIIEEAPEPEAPALIVEAVPHAEAVPHVEAVPHAEAPKALAVPAEPAQPAIPAPPENPVFVYRRAPKAETYYYVASDKSVEEKLKQIREQLKQVKEKKLSLDELDESLAALEESLKQKHEIREVAVAPRPFRAEKPGEGQAAEMVAPHLFKHVSVGKGSHVEVRIKDKEGLTMVFSVGEVSKDRYTRLVDKITKSLPSGFTLEPNFNEEGKSAVLTIKNPKAAGVDAESLVKKISEIIDEELK